MQIKFTGRVLRGFPVTVEAEVNRRTGEVEILDLYGLNARAVPFITRKMTPDDWSDVAAQARRQAFDL